LQFPVFQPIVLSTKRSAEIMAGMKAYNEPRASGQEKNINAKMAQGQR